MRIYKTKKEIMVQPVQITWGRGQHSTFGVSEWKREERDGDEEAERSTSTACDGLRRRRPSAPSPHRQLSVSPRQTGFFLPFLIHQIHFFTRITSVQTLQNTRKDIYIEREKGDGMQK